MSARASFRAMSSPKQVRRTEVRVVVIHTRIWRARKPRKQWSSKASRWPRSDAVAERSRPAGWRHAWSSSLVAWRHRYLRDHAAADAEGVGKTTREDLGQQTIEGVSATGTRTTTEIPAGAIGNEQPIKIVSEQWFSPELQVLSDEALRSPHGRNDVPPDRHRSRRAGAVALRSPARLHAEGIGHSAAAAVGGPEGPPPRGTDVRHRQP